jgi:hypothetical protein
MVSWDSSVSLFVGVFHPFLGPWFGFVRWLFQSLAHLCLLVGGISPICRMGNILHFPDFDNFLLVWSGPSRRLDRHHSKGPLESFILLCGKPRCAQYGGGSESFGGNGWEFGQWRK